MTRFMIAPLLLALALSGCSRNSDAAHDDRTGRAAEGEAGADAHGDEAQTGTHGGRLLSQDGDSVELAIAEDGTRLRTRPGCTAMANRCRPPPARWRCI